MHTKASLSSRIRITLHHLDLTQSRAYCAITSDGTAGCVGKTRFVMDCNFHLQGSCYSLEDLSDTLPIDLPDPERCQPFKDR